MPRPPAPPPPAYTVTTRVEVELSAAEAEHALRAWLLSHQNLPQARDHMGVAVRVDVDADGVLQGARLSYVPEERYTGFAAALPPD